MATPQPGLLAANHLLLPNHSSPSCCHAVLLCPLRLLLPLPAAPAPACCSALCLPALSACRISEFHAEVSRMLGAMGVPHTIEHLTDDHLFSGGWVMWHAVSCIAASAALESQLLWLCVFDNPCVGGAEAQPWFAHIPMPAALAPMSPLPAPCLPLPAPACRRSRHCSPRGAHCPGGGWPAPLHGKHVQAHGGHVLPVGGGLHCHVLRRMAWD